MMPQQVVGPQVETQFNSQNNIQTCIKLGGRTKWYTYLRAPDACAQVAPWRQTQMRSVRSIMRLLVALLGVSCCTLRHTATMYTLAALGWSIWATGAGASFRGTLFIHGHLTCSVASDSKLLQTSRGLNPPPRLLLYLSSLLVYLSSLYSCATRYSPPQTTGRSVTPATSCSRRVVLETTSLI